MSFHETLGKLMSERGLSQAQLCKMTGIATSAMSHYVRGETDPSFTKAIQIAQALGVSIDELVGSEVSSAEVSSEERNLLESFRLLSDENREALLLLASELAKTSEYTLLVGWFSITGRDDIKPTLFVSVNK